VIRLKAFIVSLQGDPVKISQLFEKTNFSTAPKPAAFSLT
jgi:hypothetical protein